jgi:hypothetical protein
MQKCLMLVSSLLLLLSCSAPICPEPVVCDLAKKDEADLRRQLLWQAARINQLTIDAMKVEIAKERCPEPSCHCAPYVKPVNHDARRVRDHH